MPRTKRPAADMGRDAGERIATAARAVRAGDLAAVKEACAGEDRYSATDPAFVQAAWLAYCNQQTVENIVIATGCGSNTALRLINEGAPSSDAFKARLASVRDLANRAQEEEMAAAIVEGTRGLATAGQVVARMIAAAKRDLDKRDKANEEDGGASFAELVATVDPNDLHKLTSTADKAMAHLRAVDAGKLPGQGDVATVIGQAFGGLLGGLATAAAKAAEDRPIEVQATNVDAFPASDPPADTPDASKATE